MLTSTTSVIIDGYDSEKGLKHKKIFNQESNEDFMEAKIIGGNPNGIINFNRTPHKFFVGLYKSMLARTWFPEQVNISKDKVNYSKLTDEEKRAYDLVLAQLIANDSIQTNQLMDSFNRYITSPVVNACLAKQAMEEALHAQSYSIMAEDICQDSDRIYNMHKHDEELKKKNEAVAKMYDSIYNNYYIYQSSSDGYIPKHIKKEPETDDITLATVANQILEELVFPGGFVIMYSLENKLTGSAEMIKEIHKDESNSHVPLFFTIFRTIIKENYDGIVPDHIISKAHEMIKTVAEAEKRWTKYASQGLLGFTDKTIDAFVENKANSVCSNLKLPKIYEHHQQDPLNKLLNDRNKGGKLEARPNFFEVNAAEYSKGTIVNDY